MSIENNKSFYFIIIATVGLLPMVSEAGLSRLKRPRDNSVAVIETNKRKNLNSKINIKTKLYSVNGTQASISKQSEVEKIRSETDKKNALEVQSFLNSRNLGITDNTNSFDVLTGTTLKGIILNSIVSSNLESPIIVQVTESSCDIPIGAKFICGGSSRGKRVQTSCLKLVALSEEFEVSASLLNVDGTAGLTGKVFTGKEEGILGALVGGGLSAALDVSRDRVATSTGEMAVNTHRNKMISGAMGGLDEAVSILGEESRNKEVKITIEAGKEVLIFINQRLKI